MKIIKKGSLRHWHRTKEANVRHIVTKNVTSHFLDISIYLQDSPILLRTIVFAPGYD